MPQLDQFPKSQQVTFKYYEGVLFFLEENYVEVRLSFSMWESVTNIIIGREPSGRSLSNLP